MSLFKGKNQSKKLSLDVFKEKMLSEVSEIKGGTASTCGHWGTCHSTIKQTIGTLNTCHDN